MQSKKAHQNTVRVIEILNAPVGYYDERHRDVAMLRTVCKRLTEAPKSLRKKRIAELIDTVAYQISDIKVVIDPVTMETIPRDEKLAVNVTPQSFFMRYGKSKKFHDWFWWMSRSLVKDVQRHAERGSYRLKTCLICCRFFWDQSTKAANRSICYNKACAKKWAVQRATESRRKSQAQKFVYTDPREIKVTKRRKRK